MYQLTCPSCSTRVGSPFVRHGAVVRCDDCEHRYRIKSSYVTRSVTTGPKTLDELDPLLRGDSVDLDQVETAEEGASAAPVSIDADGNVVGLSGLSELMRQSDAAHAQAAAIARTRAEDNTAPPTARVTRPAEPGRAAAPARARRSRAKRKSAMPIALVAVLVLLFVGTISGVAYIVTRPAEPDPLATNPGGNDPALNNPTPGTTPNGNDPDGSDPDGSDPDDGTDWITNAGGPEDNPDYAFDPNASQGPVPRPTDVPTVLTVAQPLVHEGWYILTPPRGSVEAAGGGVVELASVEMMREDEVEVVLTGQLTNRGTQAVVSGEAHLALLDSAGRVFAETYLPFAGLRPGETQEVRLTIATRFWKRARDVRTRATVFETAEEFDALADVALQPAGSGAWSSVRVTVRNPYDRWLRHALVLIWAEDVAGRTAARFVAAQQDVYIDPAGWLDIVVYVPVDDSAGPVSWHAEVIQR